MKRRLKIININPIDKAGIDLRKEYNKDKIIEKLIERPMQEPVREFTKRGVKTLMSSANINNILREGEKPKEREDVDGQENYFDRATFEDAGKGYAWIMLDFDTLTEENQKVLFRAEDLLGKKAVWFAQAYKYYTDRSPRPVFPKDEISKEFHNRMITIGYNDDYYGERVVFLRKRIDANTTVEEVEKYFTKFARCMHPQPIIEMPIKLTTDISREA